MSKMKPLPRNGIYIPPPETPSFTMEILGFAGSMLAFCAMLTALLFAAWEYGIWAGVW